MKWGPLRVTFGIDICPIFSQVSDNSHFPICGSEMKRGKTIGTFLVQIQTKFLFDKFDCFKVSFKGQKVSKGSLISLYFSKKKQQKKNKPGNFNFNYRISLNNVRGH